MKASRTTSEALDLSRFQVPKPMGGISAMGLGWVVRGIWSWARVRLVSAARVAMAELGDSFIVLTMR